MHYTTGHTVYKNKYKKEVPSVTTILKILNKPALQKWANSLGFKRQKLDDATNAKTEQVKYYGLNLFTNTDI